MKTQLLNIDLCEASITEAENPPLLLKLKESHINRAEGLAQKKAKIQKVQAVASSYSSYLEMPSYPRPPRGYPPPTHNILDPTKIIKTIPVFDDDDQN